MPQHQQEEVFDIHDYLNLSSDSDYETDQRELLEVHEAKGIALIQSSTSHSSDAPFQKHPLDNLKHKGQIEQRQNTLVQQHEVYDQAGSSRQGDTRLDAEDSKILEHYTEYILSVKKWDNSINRLDSVRKSSLAVWYQISPWRPSNKLSKSEKTNKMQGRVII
jgi:hypothetical protein